MSNRIRWNEVISMTITTLGVAAACLATVATLMFPVFQVLTVGAP